jgi:hypothetical protein
LKQNKNSGDARSILTFYRRQESMTSHIRRKVSPDSDRSEVSENKRISQLGEPDY